VKSMLGEQVDQAVLTERGVVGDRGYAVVDEETDKVVSAKSARLFPGMFECRATFAEEPRVSMPLPPVMVTPAGPGLSTTMLTSLRPPSRTWRLAAEWCTRWDSGRVTDPHAG
jgi:hypothetical protein